MSILEGKEIVKSLGQDGEFSVDITPEADLIIEVKYHKQINLVEALKAYAAKTTGTTDDKVAAAFETVINFISKKN
jgi:hypothetical protein